MTNWPLQHRNAVESVERSGIVRVRCSSIEFAGRHVLELAECQEIELIEYIESKFTNCDGAGSVGCNGFELFECDRDDCANCTRAEPVGCSTIGSAERSGDDLVRRNGIELAGCHGFE